MNELYRIFCLKPSLPRQGNPNQEGFYATNTTDGNGISTINILMCIHTHILILITCLFNSQNAAESFYFIVLTTFKLDQSYKFFFTSSSVLGVRTYLCLSKRRFIKLSRNHTTESFIWIPR